MTEAKRAFQHTERATSELICLILGYHPVGDDSAGRRWQAGEQTHGVAAVHDQGLLLSHLTQVVHHQAELKRHLSRK